MYLRTIGRRNKDGSEVRYVQLAHNEWDRERKCSIAKVIHSFGREDQLDRAALARLVGSLSRLLEPERAADRRRHRRSSSFVTRAGGRRLGARPALAAARASTRRSSRLLGGRRLDPRAERVLFALVANRALEPLSKLAATSGWLRSGSPSRGWTRTRSTRTRPSTGRWTGCWRSRPSWPSRCTGRPPTCSNLEVDLLFFDTTCTYFETRQADPVTVDEEGETRPGSAPTATPRTTAPICPRW